MRIIFNSLLFISLIKIIPGEISDYLYLVLLFILTFTIIRGNFTISRRLSLSMNKDGKKVLEYQLLVLFILVSFYSIDVNLINYSSKIYILFILTAILCASCFKSIQKFAVIIISKINSN